MPKPAAVPQEKALVRLDTKADKLRHQPGAELPDPNLVLTRNTSALNLVTDGMTKEAAEIRRACLTTPRLAPTTWPMLLETAGTRLTNEIVAERTRPRPSVTEQPATIAPTIEKATALRKELGEVVGGNGTGQEAKAALRHIIFGDRTPQGSKSGHETEYDLMLKAIAKNADDLPDAVLAFVPKLEAMRKELDEARPAPPPKKKELPPPASEPLQQATWFAHVVHDELYSWLVAVGSPTVKAAARKIFLQRRQADRDAGGPTSPEDMKLAPTEAVKPAATTEPAAPVEPAKPTS